MKFHIYNRSPNISHLRIFGCLAYPKDLTNKDKFGPTAIPCALLGFSIIKKGYVLYNLSKKIVFVSREVIFCEDIFPFKNLNNMSFMRILILMLNKSLLFQDDEYVFEHSLIPESSKSE